MQCIIRVGGAVGISKHPFVTDLVASIFSPGFRKNFTGWANFPPGCPFPSGRCFVLFLFFQTYTNDICWVCKSRTGEAINWRVKLKISPGTKEAKFSLGEGKKSTRSLIEGCFQGNMCSPRQQRKSYCEGSSRITVNLCFFFCFVVSLPH